MGMCSVPAASSRFCTTLSIVYEAPDLMIEIWSRRFREISRTNGCRGRTFGGRGLALCLREGIYREIPVSTFPLLGLRKNPSWGTHIGIEYKFNVD